MSAYTIQVMQSLNPFFFEKLLFSDDEAPPHIEMIYHTRL
jgi:hypothetical protein